MSFIDRLMHFNGSSRWLAMPARSELNNQSILTVSFCFAFENLGWPSSDRTLLSQNVSGQRHFGITAKPRGGLGEIALGFHPGGPGATLFNAYVPDGTCEGTFPHHFMGGIANGVPWCRIDDRPITLQNISPSMPAMLGTSTAEIVIGAVGVNHVTTWFGTMADVALWPGWKPSDEQCHDIWGRGRAVPDLRTLETIQQPLIYVPGNTSPPTDVISGITLSGAVDVATAPLPPVYIMPAEEMFTKRQVLNLSDEPWQAGFHYCASPNFKRVGNKTIVAFSRGSAHIPNHRCYMFFVRDGDDYPVSGKTWPLSTSGDKEYELPMGVLSGLEGSRRSPTMEYFEDEGDLGEGRLWMIFNETDFDQPRWPTTAVTVFGNVATANVPGHLLTTGDWIYTSGVTTPTGDLGHPVQCTVVGDLVSYPCVAPNGAMADGVGLLFQANPQRKTWGWYCDNAISAATPSAMVWEGLARINDGLEQSKSSLGINVGRGRVVKRQNDGTHILGMYRLRYGQSAYEAVQMRSTNGKPSGFQYQRTIAISPNLNSGFQFEEPYHQYVPAQGLRYQMRVDFGQDDRIVPGLNNVDGLIVSTISTDDGDSNPVPSVAYPGRHHPIFAWFDILAPQGVMFGFTAAPVSYHHADNYNGPPFVMLSKDKGATWVGPFPIPSDHPEGRQMQGDFIFNNGHVQLIWASDYVSGVSTRMWVATFDDAWIAAMLGIGGQQPPPGDPVPPPPPEQKTLFFNVHGRVDLLNGEIVDASAVVDVTQESPARTWHLSLSPVLILEEGE